MAETLYLTPAGTPPLSPAQAPRKKKCMPTLEQQSNFASVQLNNSGKEAKPTTTTRVPPSRVPKTKQTKSRNGCHTCKAKRLKCDETKPTCQNCARRNVECEGYKKEFKWKGFPEQNIGRKLIREPMSSNTQYLDPACIDAHFQNASASILQHTESNAQQLISSVSANTSNDTRPLSWTSRIDENVQQASAPDEDIIHSNANPHETHSIHCVDNAIPGIQQPASSSQPLQTATTPSSLDTVYDYDLPRPESYHSDDFHTFSAFSDDDRNALLQEENQWPLHTNMEVTNQAWLSALISPLQQQIPASMPSISQSPDTLIRRFFTSTCSVMSIFPFSDTWSNPQLYPWQNLIWPLVQGGKFPMLLHGLLSMACFQGSQTDPTLRLEGLDHMRTSLDLLQKNDTWLNLPIEVILATCLALGFSESWMCWKPLVKSGSSYIKNAKQCILHALKNGAQTKLQKRQLRFLCKTYLYIDVISRLTSIDSDVSNDAVDSIATQILGMSFDNEQCSANTQLHDLNPSRGSYTGFERNADLPSQQQSPTSMSARLDPLMGSASTLFPIIGRVTNLVRRVCKSQTSTPSIISAAVDLKQQLETWTPASNSSFDRLQEEADHTAEAYRLATLLHLYQSVPELLPPNQSLSGFSATMGRRILNYLARIPTCSGTLIVQIYPLLVGGCEVLDEEDRSWVQERWAVMERRMGIGNVEKAKEVVAEVWRRRDGTTGLFTRSNPPPTSPQPFCWDDLLLTGDVTQCKPGSELERFSSWGEELSFDETFSPSGVGCKEFDGASCFDNPHNVTIGGKGGRSDAASEFIENYANELDLTVRGRLHWAGVMKEWDWEVLLG